MSTELINKLSKVLAEYRALDQDLAKVDRVLGFAESRPDDLRVVLRFSAAGETLEFPYPTQTAINQLNTRRDQIVASMTAIEDKLESALSDT